MMLEIEIMNRFANAVIYATNRFENNILESCCR